jgi:hypothetical protein
MALPYNLSRLYWRQLMPNTDPYSGSFTIPNQLHAHELSFDGRSVTVHASTGNLVAQCALSLRAAFASGPRMLHAHLCSTGG